MISPGSNEYILASEKKKKKNCHKNEIYSYFKDISREFGSFFERIM